MPDNQIARYDGAANRLIGATQSSLYNGVNVTTAVTELTIGCQNFYFNRTPEGDVRVVSQSLHAVISSDDWQRVIAAVQGV